MLDPDGMRVSLFERMEDQGANHGASAEELEKKEAINNFFNETLNNDDVITGEINLTSGSKFKVSGAKGLSP